MVVEKQQFCLQ